MRKKFNEKTKRFVALVINFQLVISTSYGASTTNKVLEGIGKGAEVAEKIGGSFIQGYKKSEMEARALNLANQMKQTLSVKALNPMEVSPLFATFGCTVLEAKTTSINESSQCNPKTFNPQNIPMYMALQSVAEANAKQYKTFNIKGNSAFEQGRGCYENAIEDFNQQLQARVAQIDELSNNIDRETEDFKKLNEKTLEDIKKRDALLTGKDPNGKYLKDYKFENHFKDKECASVFAAQTFSKYGSKGFRGIEDELSKKSDEAVKLNGRISNITSDIKKVSQSISDYIQKNDINKINMTSNLPVITNYGIDKLPAYKNIIKKKDLEKSNKLNDIKRKFSKLGGGKEESQVLQSILNENGDINNAIKNYESSQKNNCLNRLLTSNFNGASGLLDRLQDPNISKKLNKEADNAFKTFVQNTLANPELTIEEKIRDIRNEEQKSNNKRFTLVTGKSLDIDGVKIGASTRMKASDMVGVFTRNCNKRFDNVKNNNGITKRDFINGLREYADEFKAYKNTFANDVKAEIINQLINCPNDKTTGSASNSCDDALNIKSPTFCVKAANICSGNINVCLGKAKQLKEETRNVQKQKADIYRKKLDFFKTALTKSFQLAEAKLKVTARTLDAQFKAGTLYETPKDFKLGLENKEFLDGLDKSLEIEDPEKYVKRIKENLKKVKQNIEKQNKQISEAVKKEKERYLKNYANEEKQWEKIANACLDLISNFYKQQNENTKKQNEEIKKQNEELANYCKRIDTFNANPAAGCYDDAGDLAKDGLKIAAVAGDASAIGKLKKYEKVCDTANNEGTNPFIQNQSRKKREVRQISILEFCKLDEAKQFQAECEAYESSSDSSNACSKERLFKHKGSLCKVTSNNQTSIVIDETDNGCDTAEKRERFEDIKELASLTEVQIKDLLGKLDEKCLTESDLQKDQKENTKLLRELAQQYTRAQEFKQAGEVRVAACHAINPALGTIDKVINKASSKLGEISSQKDLFNISE